jgi:hypothetical protein
MEPRLKTGIWVKALIRRCDLRAIGVAVVARGDADAGTVLIRLSGREPGVTVLAPARQPDGTLGWMRATGPAPVAEDEAASYIDRQRRRDPDLWVIEIETPSPQDVLDGAIIG